ncbi:hypothetical protein N1851_010625 [Merluccius polli]|uniref:Uncharacterized protein n=1 Tax=Merluccius polli TaxID=89951 RepID=A0AA47P353_MERPO|nr:hypothetical protein N1851_010625 [Merluccius polli]
MTSSSSVLQTRVMYESHTAVNVNAMFHSVADEWKLTIAELLIVSQSLQYNLASKMNPANSDLDPVQQMLLSQAADIKHHEDQLTSVARVQEFAARLDRSLNSIREQMQQLFLSARAPAAEARLLPPE